MPSPARGAAVLHLGTLVTGPVTYNTSGGNLKTVAIGPHQYTLPCLFPNYVDWGFEYDQVWVAFFGRTGLILGPASIDVST